jgi:hypothetical protein
MLFSQWKKLAMAISNAMLLLLLRLSEWRMSGPPMALQIHWCSPWLLGRKSDHRSKSLLNVVINRCIPLADLRLVSLGLAGLHFIPHVGS